MQDKEDNDIKMLDNIVQLLKDGYFEDSAEVVSRLKCRLSKLHYYEWVFFNGRDFEEAKQCKQCTNDQRDFIRLDLESAL